MLGLLVALLAAGSAAQEARQDEPIPEDVAAALIALHEAGQPTQQHALLAPLEGSWTVEARWTLPGSLGAELEGRSENRWTLGERFMRCDAWVGEGAARVEASSLYGFDRGTGLFTAVGAADVATSLFATAGHYDPETRSFVLRGEYRNPISAAVTTYRQRLVIEGPDQYSLELFYDPRGALPYSILSATFRRAASEIASPEEAR